MIALVELRGAAHPVLVERYLLLAADFATISKPWTLRVTSVLRRLSQQVALFAQGRKPLAIVNELRQKAGMTLLSTAEENKKVTDADGIIVKSNHQGVLVNGVLFAVALDVVVTTDPDGPGPMKAIVSWDDMRYFPLLPLAKRHGLVSGGSWKDKRGKPKPDWPHLELPKGVLAA